MYEPGNYPALPEHGPALPRHYPEHGGPTVEAPRLVAVVLWPLVPFDWSRNDLYACVP